MRRRIGATANARDLDPEALVVMDPVAGAEASGPIVPCAASEDALALFGDRVGACEAAFAFLAEFLEERERLFAKNAYSLRDCVRER